MDYQDSMFEIRPSGDYLHVVCMQCKTDCEIDFKGRDAIMVEIEIKCPNCGIMGDWKLWRAGFSSPQGVAVHQPLGSALTTRLDS
jgi:DNA-directed RNA polymerase subunit RPC12/RpoP